MHQLFVPTGFLHGFVTLESDTEVQYKCSAGYEPEADAAVRWDDPDIAVRWPLETAPTLSRKDAEAPFLSSVVSPF